MLEGAKLIGAGAATIASAGAAIGIGNVLSSSIHSVARNPSLAKQSFGYAILGFALTEAIASFAPMIAFLISSVFRSKNQRQEGGSDLLVTMLMEGPLQYRFDSCSNLGAYDVSLRQHWNITERSKEGSVIPPLPLVDGARICGSWGACLSISFLLCHDANGQLIFSIGISFPTGFYSKDRAVVTRPRLYEVTIHPNRHPGWEQELGSDAGEIPPMAEMFSSPPPFVGSGTPTMLEKGRRTEGPGERPNLGFGQHNKVLRRRQNGAGFSKAGRGWQECPTWDLGSQQEMGRGIAIGRMPRELLGGSHTKRLRITVYPRNEKSALVICLPISSEENRLSTQQKSSACHWRKQQISKTASCKFTMSRKCAHRALSYERLEKALLLSNQAQAQDFLGSVMDFFLCPSLSLYRLRATSSIAINSSKSASLTTCLSSTSSDGTPDQGFEIVIGGTGFFCLDLCIWGSKLAISALSTTNARQEIMLLRPALATLMLLPCKEERYVGIRGDFPEDPQGLLRRLFIQDVMGRSTRPRERGDEIGRFERSSPFRRSVAPFPLPFDHDPDFNLGLCFPCDSFPFPLPVVRTLAFLTMISVDGGLAKEACVGREAHGCANRPQSMSLSIMLRISEKKKNVSLRYIRFQETGIDRTKVKQARLKGESVSLGDMIPRENFNLEEGAIISLQERECTMMIIQSVFQGSLEELYNMVSFGEAGSICLFNKRRSSGCGSLFHSLSFRESLHRLSRGGLLSPGHPGYEPDERIGGGFQSGHYRRLLVPSHSRVRRKSTSPMYKRKTARGSGSDQLDKCRFLYPSGELGNDVGREPRKRDVARIIQMLTLDGMPLAGSGSYLSVFESNTPEGMVQVPGFFIIFGEFPASRRRNACEGNASKYISEVEAEEHLRPVSRRPDWKPHRMLEAKGEMVDNLILRRICYPPRHRNSR
ncbi:ATPase subunit 9 [Tanacetum coccineum]|uniref:ATPase subunit 9 n=1 Tax=Tanacetum coccineum TaxID=301880 RepID=A0ABQ5IU91_9ASTR